MPHIGAKKLIDAVANSDKLLEPFRRQYAEAIEAYGGQHWGDGSRRKRQVINLGNRFVKTMVAHLGAGNPEHDCVASNRKLRPHAALLQLTMDHLAQERRWYKTSRMMLKTALLAPCAYMRIGLKAGDGIHTIDGEEYDMGQPFRIPVSLDDIVVDPGGRCREEFLWEGYRYRPWRGSLYNAPRHLWTRYGRQKLESLPPLEDGVHAEKFGGSEHVSNFLPANDRFGAIDAVELLDIVVRESDHRFLIFTISGDPDYCDDFLMVREWQGPRCGPLLRLEFDPMPDAPFGVPPVVTAREQGDLANSMIVKLSNQFERLKTVLGYMPGHEDEADIVRTAEDGHTFQMRDPDAVRAFEMGAVNMQIIPFANMLRQLTDEAQGNISILSGQSKADSATEYSGQSANANVLLADMQRVHEEFETELSRADAWYLHYDPMIKIPFTKRMRNGYLIDLEYSAEQRAGEWLDYNLSIRTNSMTSRRHDPQVRARRMIELVGVTIQAAQAALATNGLLDLAGTVRVLGDEFGIQRLDEMIGDPILAAQMDQIVSALPGFEGMPAVRGMMPPMGGAGAGGATSNRYTSEVGNTRGALSILPQRGAA